MLYDWNIYCKKKNNNKKNNNKKKKKNKKKNKKKKTVKHETFQIEEQDQRALELLSLSLPPCPSPLLSKFLGLSLITIIKFAKRPALNEAHLTLISLILSKSHAS
jgi:hypothetical protein